MLPVRRGKASRGPEGRVMAGLALSIVQIARAAGVDLADVLTAYDLDLDMLSASDAYVPVALHERLWAEAAMRTGRTDFGMFAAERFTPGLTGAVEYVLRNCSTVRDAAETWVRFAPAVSDCISARLVEHEGAMKLSWSLARPPSPGTSQWSEFAQARTLKLMRDALGAPELAPTEVWFRHAELGPLDRHRAYFRAPVRFKRPETALVWPKALLEQPLQWVDATLRRALQERADRLLQEVAVRRSTEEQVNAALAELVVQPGGDLRLSRVSERLRVPARTLQARLAQCGLTFRMLASQVRSQAAARLLAEGNLTVLEVARRVGFSDASALRRALRRSRAKAGHS
jgi:AraC-like DNA-binding protein